MSPNTESQIFIASSDSELNYLLERALFAAGFTVTLVSDPALVERRLLDLSTDLMIIAERIADADGIELSAKLAAQYPAIPIIFIARADTPELLREALRAGVTDFLCLPLRSDQLLNSVNTAIDRAVRRKEWVIMESRRATAGLQRRLDESETLMRLSRSITSTLDLDSVLTAVVDAAVELTGAEEGSLLLIDSATGELYMRAAKNFNEDFVSTFRLPVKDSLAGDVIRSGQPFILDEKTPKKIKTSYLVQGLLYVPLQIHGRTIGVL
ncbi:MAG TPA: GAF domain-containing protein, partial [Anaerolineaceae bacterium]|nr:GAF domain-containing protein [Anaerolineaceae bacterium]